MNYIIDVQAGHTPKVLRQEASVKTAQFAPNTDAEIRILLDHLPEGVQGALRVLQHEGRDLTTLQELNVQIGRKPEAVFADEFGRKERVFITQGVCTEGDVNLFAPLFQEHGLEQHKRVGLSGTLHRLSFTVHPAKASKVIAVTARVGRAVEGIIDRMAPFLLNSTQSLLLIGRPSVGKTTLLRELARSLSTASNLIVVVVDKTCEIAGDGVSPHASIGSARWMPVGKSGLQAQILREAVENQSPDIIICDEISTHDEVEAARTIAQRGVRLIATVHGVTLPELINDGERRSLVGGQTSVTLTDAAAERRPDRRKAVNVRLREPVFAAALELHAREEWVWHPSVREAVDGFYAGEPVRAEVLRPGRGVAALALPQCDGFIYCLECGRLDRLCHRHAAAQPAGGAAAAAAAPRGPKFGGVSAAQRSGQCYGCGEAGHYKFECPNR